MTIHNSWQGDNGLTYTEWAVDIKDAELIELAQCDPIQIDFDKYAEVSRCENGAWVQAWVFVTYPKNDDTG